MKFYIFLFLLSASLSFAQEKAADKPIVELDALTIESSPLGTKSNKSTQAWSVLTDKELERAKGTTIAETLMDTPGVSQTHFGTYLNPLILCCL